MGTNIIDLHRFSYICFSIFTITISNCNSRTSSHWIYSVKQDQVLPVDTCCSDKVNCKGCLDLSCHDTVDCENSEDLDDKDGRELMEILTTKASSRNFNLEEVNKLIIGRHKTDKIIEYYKEKLKVQPKITEHPTTIQRETPKKSSLLQSPQPPPPPPPPLPSSPPPPSSIPVKHTTTVKVHHSPQTSGSVTTPSGLISCQPYVNQTQYDHLNGIHNRDSFRILPEPEVALIFAKSRMPNGDFKINLNSVEIKLQQAKSKRPKSPSVYNNIGNLLRIHGESREAVECFRSALYLSPHHPDVLLNLARVLYNQNFLDDAIYLTRHSLETQPPNRNPWLQHFTLGEILYATGHHEEAKHHFLNVLRFNSGFKAAQQYLQSIDQHQSGGIDPGSPSNGVGGASGNININGPTTDGNTLMTTIYCTLISLFFLILVLYAAFVNMETIEAESESPKVVCRHYNRARTNKASNCRNRPRRG